MCSQTREIKRIKSIPHCIHWVYESILSQHSIYKSVLYINSLAQDCGNSIANAMQLPQSCAMQSIPTISSIHQCDPSHIFNETLAYVLCEPAGKRLYPERRGRVMWLKVAFGAVFITYRGGSRCQVAIFRRKPRRIFMQILSIHHFVLMDRTAMCYS